MDKELQVLKERLADAIQRNMQAQVENQRAYRAEKAARSALFEYVNQQGK